MNHNKLWKILQEMEIPDHLSCLLRNLCSGQEATVGTGHGTTHSFKMERSMSRLSPCLFNFYMQYLMRNARQDESQTRTMITKRNINNLRYTDDTTLNSRKQRGTKELLDEG